MTQAGHNRGQSRQDYETPLVFIHAVERMFGPLHVDLAATEKNAKAKFCLTPEDDSLKQYWGVFSKQRCWLNPPYSSIGPWAQKCAMYPQLEILFLLLFARSGSWNTCTRTRRLFSCSPDSVLTGRTRTRRTSFWHGTAPVQVGPSGLGTGGRLDTTPCAAYR